MALALTALPLLQLVFRTEKVFAWFVPGNSSTAHELNPGVPCGPCGPSAFHGRGVSVILQNGFWFTTMLPARPFSVPFLFFEHPPYVSCAVAALAIASDSATAGTMMRATYLIELLMCFSSLR